MKTIIQAYRESVGLPGSAVDCAETTATDDVMDGVCFHQAFMTCRVVIVSVIIIMYIVTGVIIIAVAMHRRFAVNQCC